MEGSAVGIFANEPLSSTVALRMAARTLPLMSPEPSGLLLLMLVLCVTSFSWYGLAE